MPDSSEAWLLTLQRLRREQNTAEAAVARKTQEHQATADAWASRVVRPAFATLAQHFNQGSDKRSLVVRPDIPQESLALEPPRGIGVVSGSPGGRLPVRLPSGRSRGGQGWSQRVRLLPPDQRR